MAQKGTQALRKAVGISAALVLVGFAPAAVAHTTSGLQGPHKHGEPRTVRGEQYIPNIWVDPDGCEHWVMDDGWEGYMTPKVNRQGIPSCPGRQTPRPAAKKPHLYYPHTHNGPSGSHQHSHRLGNTAHRHPVK